MFSVPYAEHQWPGSVLVPTRPPGTRHKHAEKVTEEMQLSVHLSAQSPSISLTCSFCFSDYTLITCIIRTYRNSPSILSAFLTCTYFFILLVATNLPHPNLNSAGIKFHFYYTAWNLNELFLRNTNSNTYVYNTKVTSFIFTQLMICT